jgi:hypothetical protein
MERKVFKKSGLPVRKTSELLPEIFQTSSNDKFLSATLDALVQPGSLERLSGYIGKSYGKTFNTTDIYLDVAKSLRYAYQLEPGVVVYKDNKVKSFYDYIDFKNQIKFFNNLNERDDLTTGQENYTWNPPIEWDKFINYREYYWLPTGPETVIVEGQGQAVISSYRVRSDGENEWLFFPDGLKRNPSITLYRGQTYEFNVNAPGDPFYLRTSNTQGSSTNYNKGVTNNGIEVGTVTFVVPNDSPDLLYYQSGSNLNRIGSFRIANITDNTNLNVETEILGKASYTSSNGVVFTNGLKVEFIGKTTPAKYAGGAWIVEGVGNAIKLVAFADLELPPISNPDAEVVFDDAGFDEQPFDDATSYPTTKDYITINRSSIDRNPWSRYNRWFHRSVLEYSAQINGSSPALSEDTRAKRPIIEFEPDLQLYNHGSVIKSSVDLIDDFTTDIFSTIEGSAGYNIDNETVFDGARVLFTADTDVLVKNKIYVVKFITIQNSTNIVNRRQISLIEAEDAVSQEGECVIVRKGKNNAGIMYHFSNDTWTKSQQKTAINQAPLFDAFDEDGVSFSDNQKYTTTSFKGSEIVSYKVSSSSADQELGFGISYLNINNSGDILFESDWEKDSFTSQTGNSIVNTYINSGYFRKNLSLTDVEYYNTWSLFNNDLYQPIIQTVTIDSPTSTVEFSACEWDQVTREQIFFYLNGDLIKDSYTSEVIVDRKFTFLNRTFAVGDVLTIKIYTNAEPKLGFYEFPVSLERNPLNQSIEQFTLGQANDHLRTMIEPESKFVGEFPGSSNLRDLTGYRQNGKRFLKHASIPAVALPMLCDKNINIVKALRSAGTEYEKFKSNFLSLAVELPYNNNDPIAFFDEIISKLSKIKTQTSAFSNSDMIGSGAFKSIKYQVEDEGIKVFALTDKFDLTTPSSKAVYVYKNNEQLLVNHDYEFDSTFGFVRLKIDLVEGDNIEIKEFFSTAFNFIPETPTKLGLYKKYTPRLFVDDTFVTPRTVIQGHDGSITISYGDFRDELLLELEKRIYNNIKIEYDKNIFDIDATLGGFYGNSTFSKHELDNILETEFLRWTATSSLNLYTNSYSDPSNPFTYTYGKAVDITKTTKMPNYWRGIYKFLFDTDRPHTCPWEMLGLSEKPSWWEDEYGPAPYTKGNLLLWEDLRDGIIRQGPLAGQYNRYARPTLISHIPVDDDGNLLPPTAASAVINYANNDISTDFEFGDIAPVEYAWRRTSLYPFSIILALSVLRPFEFLSLSYDRSSIKRNKIGQLVSETNTFITLNDVSTSANDTVKPIGLFSYIIDYLKLNLVDTTSLSTTFENLDLRLSNRIGGFVDKAQQKYLLDSKSPQSKTSGVFIPAEDYEVFFNKSSPSKTLSYSGVVVEKVESGWKISGYDKLNSSFTYFKAVAIIGDPVFSVGGVSESFVDWSTDKFYARGTLVRIEDKFYRSISAHNSGTSFDSSLWVPIPQVPLVGATTAIKRSIFNTAFPESLPYGTILTSVQEVVDFLLGYGESLAAQGLVFDDYNSDLQVPSDWETSCKEFMFWTSHNWAIGSIIALSPCALKLKIQTIDNVADNLLDSFYEYAIFRSDGTKFTPTDIQVYRTYNEFILTPLVITDGIYFARINYVLKEHVVVFNDRTVFNDVIFDKGPGYRQERLKVIGFRTTDWDGDYTSPGFIFDDVNIAPWQQFTDYRLGDIVQYKEFNYVSKGFQKGSSEFSYDVWEKLDSNPTTGLVPNFDFRISQIEDYFELDSISINADQRKLSRHTIGYQDRDYLQSLAEDDVSQFRLYQGFIKEKGTNNSVTKVFDKISSLTEDTVELNEEWAFRLGSFGGTAQFTEAEFSIQKDSLKLNPQPLLMDNTGIVSANYQNYVILSEDNYKISDKSYKFPTTTYSVPLYSAGYVNPNDVKFVVKNLNDVFNQDITTYKHGDLIWCTFTDLGWDVLRYTITNVAVAAAAVADTTTVILETFGVHNFAVDDIIGLTNIKNLTGFFRIKGVGLRSILLEIEGYTEQPEIDQSSFCKIAIFKSIRVADYLSLITDEYSQLPDGTKVWVDNNGSGQWEIVQRTKQYSVTQISEYGVAFPTGTGASVVYVPEKNQTIVSNPGGVVTVGDASRESAVIVYSQGADGLIPLQILVPQSGLEDTFLGSYGTTTFASADGRWLIVGSPNASYIPSNYRETFDPAASYKEGDTVLYAGKLWKAVNPVTGDGSSISLTSEDWEPATIHLANPLGKAVYDINQGYRQQGAIEIFEYDQGQWNFRQTIISPRPGNGELFGKSIAIGKKEGIEGTSGDVTLTVAAINSEGGIVEVDAVGISGLNDAVYENVSGVDISTAGTDASFDVLRRLGEYTVTVRNGGTRYVKGDRIKITGNRLGGSSPLNDLIITVTSVDLDGQIIGSETYTNITGINSELPETEAVFTVTKIRNLYTTPILTTAGLGYTPRSIVRYATNDRLYACIKDTGIDRGVWNNTRTYYPGDLVKYPAASTIYYEVLQEVTGVVPVTSEYYAVHTPILPTNTEYWQQVSGGVYPSLAVTWAEKDSAGTLIKYTVGSTILVPGSELGGTTPENDLLIYVNKINPDTSISSFVSTGLAAEGISYAGTPITGERTYNDVVGEDISDPGIGSIFTITRSRGSYSASINVRGERYAVGDQIKILGTTLGGVKEEYYLAVTAPGSLDDIGRTYLYTFDGIEWKQDEDLSFVGVFNPSTNYPEGSTVWYSTSYWKAITNHVGDGSTVPSASNWEQIVSLNTGILPKSTAFTDDGSTIQDGVYTGDVELLTAGDQYGTSVSMSGDGSIMVIGASKADSTTFVSYKGVWKSYITYYEGDTVKRNSGYYTLTSSTSTNQIPEVVTDSWVPEVIEDAPTTGAVFVYTKDENDSFVLTQTINGTNINSFLTDSTEIEAGDEFGKYVLVSPDAQTMFVSAPNSDIRNNDQGAVFVFKLLSGQYRFIQKIKSYTFDSNEKFGSTISLSPDGNTLAVGAEGAETFKPTFFDNGNTAFDRYLVNFKDAVGKTGKVFVYNKYLDTYILSELFDQDLNVNEDFGRSIATSNDSIIVGSPAYLSEDPAFQEIRIGRIQKFTKQQNTKSWNPIRQQEETVDVSKLKSLAFYDGNYNVKIADIDIVDPFKGKILSLAEQDIDFKTPYDPSIYSIGTSDNNVNPDQEWGEDHVGLVWWNTATAKWILYEQGDVSYRSANWGALAEGSTIDVYEWVESNLTPAEWAATAQTTSGFSQGITGTPLHPDNSNYSKKELIDTISGLVTTTKYYFWVKNKQTLEVNSTKTLTAASIANLITNPMSGGLPFVALTGTDTLSIYNTKSFVSSDEFLVNVQFYKTSKNVNLIHNEYHLLSEGTTKYPNYALEQKWIDSLVGEDITGKEVPDRTLSEKLKYGIESSPRQTMFVNRNKAVEITVSYINNILATYPLADSIDYTTLNLVDTAPSAVKNLYDTTVGTVEELTLISTSKIQPATLRANIINGHINTVDVITPGYGYRTAPPVEIIGTGKGAQLKATIDTFGRIISVTVEKSGNKYTEATLRVRPFSVLVTQDSTVNNFWSIWSWNERSKEFFRSATQSFETSKYWQKIDWWQSGYSTKSRITANLPGLYAEQEVELEVGQLLRLDDYGQGGWAVLERVDAADSTILDKYRLVGRNLGTIEIINKFYNTDTESYGYDKTQTYDSNKYDTSAAIEFRNILKAVKEDIFVGDLLVEWNKLFFANIHYVFSEQQYVDWVFKSSFVDATHNVGYFAKKLNYKSDSLDSYREYINEVKPYRTKIRQYTSRYLNLDNTQTAVTDFDLPPTYDVNTNTIVPVKFGDSLIDLYPRKYWLNNHTYEVTELKLVSQGTGYSSAPTVVFQGGDGTGAKGKAFISNGKVTRIVLTASGSGYSSAPIVKLVGGVGSAVENAGKVVAFIGNSKARTFDMTMKFDRYSKTPKFKSYSKNELFKETETFPGIGNKTTFTLKYPPTQDKSKISVYVRDPLVTTGDGVKLLAGQYSISLYTTVVSGYTELRGKLTINTAPVDGAVVKVVYEKNDEILDSLNRIDKYYKPTEGMLGFEKTPVSDVTGAEVINDYSQLVTGIDFGGVIVQGATFNVGAGWDALPWFTEGWDSAENNDSDFYVSADGSTHEYILPTPPAAGQNINIYIRKFGEMNAQRLDYPTYDAYKLTPFMEDGSTLKTDVPPDTAVMNTFVGDGSTVTIIIPDEVIIADGDVMIFRPDTSDGSLLLAGRNQLDAEISGGTLSGMSAYDSALGTTAAEIVLDGEKFVSPDQVPAPEENIPGQVLESVSIKVFHTDRFGAPALLTNVYTSDGTTELFNIGQTILENRSVIVYVNKVKKTLGTDYTIASDTNQVRFIGTIPGVGAIVEIISISVGGVEILDVREFEGDGSTRYFLTGASYYETGNVFASINGTQVAVGFVNSNGFKNDTNDTLVEFGIAPPLGRKIFIVALSSESGVVDNPLVRINQQRFVLDELVRTYPIESFVSLGVTEVGNTLVTLNNNLLESVDTVYKVYDGITTDIPIGLDPLRDFGEIIPAKLRVYVNNELKSFGFDYQFDSDANVVTMVSTVVTIGDIIRIEDYSNTKYTIQDSNIILDEGLIISTGDILEIEWFDRYSQIDFVKDVYTGGKVSYTLQRPALNISYGSVYKNGVRLTPDIEYYLADNKDAVILRDATTDADLIETVFASGQIYKAPMAFEIFKDAFNVNHFNRYSIKEVTLAQDLNYYDTDMVVSDASLLATPALTQPGIVTILGEKIQYLSKVGNVLKNIRRGMFGTGIGTSYAAGTIVVDTGFAEVIPYKETQEKEDFAADGTTLLIGPLTFVPTKATRSSWTRDTIPDEYGACDQIEVFVGGRRLRKDPITIYNETVGSYSPAGDVIQEAEFSVDGTTEYIRLTDPVTAGTRITVIRRLGKTWYNLGTTTVSNGTTLSNSTTAIAKFLQNGTTKLPE